MGFFQAQDASYILFALADDWGDPRARAYGGAGVEGPRFDRMAREGLLVRRDIAIYCTGVQRLD